jgi:hypothetical protein
MVTHRHEEVPGAWAARASIGELVELRDGLFQIGRIQAPSSPYPAPEPFI